MRSYSGAAVSIPADTYQPPALPGHGAGPLSPSSSSDADNSDAGGTYSPPKLPQPTARPQQVTPQQQGQGQAASAAAVVAPGSRGDGECVILVLLVIW